MAQLYSCPTIAITINTLMKHVPCLRRNKTILFLKTVNFETYDGCLEWISRSKLDLQLEFLSGKYGVLCSVDSYRPAAIIVHASW